MKPNGGALRLPSNKKWLVFGTVAIGTFMSVMDQTSVNLGLPRIADQFGASIPAVQWVSLGYILVTGSLMLPMGRLSDIIGRNRVYALGVILFTLGAILAGSSNSLFSLIMFKVIQGVGAAMVQANGIAILASTFPVNERGKILGLFMTVIGVGAITGPVIGGIVVSVLGWRFIFFLCVPFGIASIIAAIRFLELRRVTKSEGHSMRRGFDWIGAALSSCVMGLFLLTITNAYRLGWNSPLVVAAFATIAGLLIVFIWWERRVADPMLALDLFKNRLFSTGSAAAFFIFLSGTSINFLMPFYLQKVLNFTPARAGLMMAIGALCFALVGPVSGRLSDRFGPRMFTVFGAFVYGSALVLLTQITVSTPVILVVASLSLQGIGMGIFYSPNTNSVMSTVEPERYGIVSAFVNMVRNLGNVTGIGIATAIVTGVMASSGYEPTLDAVTTAQGGGGVVIAFTNGLRTAYLVMIACIGLALLLSLVKGKPLQRTKSIIH